MSYIAVLGAGSWGSTLAKLLAEKDYDVSLWVHEEDLAREISQTGVNSVFLPGVELPRSLKASADFERVLRGSRYVVSVVPTQFVRSVMRVARPHIERNAVVVSASKGIENKTFQTVTSIVHEMTGLPAAALSGPSFASEVVRRLPTAVTLACRDRNVGLLLQELFTTDYFRVYTHHDVIGTELGGALKNVMAVAAGISEGLGLGSNARAALITRGLMEMTRLGVCMGAEEKTFFGLSGLGDLVLTCTSTQSRNYTVGRRLGQGEKLKEILASMTAVAEGVSTTRAAHALATKKRVEMPIVEQVHAVLYEEKDPREAVTALMTRLPKAEF
ncbi:MAG: NAD(P)-dependent glycerol-3-phosphate dehydrogenase [Nitrospirota bacterium]